MAEATTTTADKPTKARPSREEAKCTKEGCKRPYRAKGYCNVHYKAWRRGEMEEHTARYKVCTKEGCKKPRAAQGSLCEEHLKADKASA